jgi:hypothetical protein
MKSPIVKRSIVLSGHKTSVSRHRKEPPGGTRSGGSLRVVASACRLCAPGGVGVSGDGCRPDRYYLSTRRMPNIFAQCRIRNDP